jgi:hypothetical protein
MSIYSPSDTVYVEESCNLNISMQEKSCMNKCALGAMCMIVNGKLCENE